MVRKKLGLAVLALVVVAPFLIQSCGSSPSSPAPAATSTPTSSFTPTITSTPTLTFTPTPFTQQATISLGTLHPYTIRTAPNGNIWILQQSPALLMQITSAGATAIAPVSVFNTSESFSNPSGIAVDPASGDVYVADTNNGRVVIFDSSGSWLEDFGSTQIYCGCDAGIAVNAAGTTVYVGKNGVPSSELVYSVAAGSPPTVTYQTAIGPGVAGGLGGNVNGQVVDGSGNLYVTDWYNNRVVKYNGSGTYQLAVTLASLGSPLDVAVDLSGNIFPFDTHNGTIVEFNPSGQYLNSVTGAWNGASDIALDTTGNLIYLSELAGSQLDVYKIH
ncbi:MAG TPA: NHL repeat-containing protein [bacterium]